MMQNKNLFIETEQPVKGGKLLQPLIKIRGRQCQCCKNTKWLGLPINLQVHHIDGNRRNNKLDNLQLLCLNCHSYTNNFGSKNIKHQVPISEEVLAQTLSTSSSIRQAFLKLNMSDAGANYTRARKICEKYNIVFPEKIKIKEKYCQKCGKPITLESQYCIECRSFLARKVIERPTREKLKELIRNEPFTKIAKQYNVSDKAIVKWCIAQNLPHKKKDIKLYSNQEWEKI